MSLHFWSLGLVLAVEELRESPPLNGMNTARKPDRIQKALVERWEPQREEKPRRWGGQTVGDSSGHLRRTSCQGSPKIEVYLGPSG